MCWYESACFSTAATCCPPLWAKAPYPTKGCCSGRATFAISATVRERSLERASDALGNASIPSFKTRLATTDTRFAFPQRSPYPLIVPWTMSAPAATPSRVLATASSQSLWQWMPTPADWSTSASARRTACTPSRISPGRLPPLVSHSTIQLAPARAASRQTSIAYSESRAKPSKKCSASKITSFPPATPCATDSRTIARFSFGVVCRTLLTCHVSLFPTSVHAGAPLRASALRLASSSHVPPALRVAPNAARRECLSGCAASSANSSSSFGFDPGKPPST